MRGPVRAPAPVACLDVNRPEPPLTGDERETLRVFLDFHRATLAMKCDGLSDEDLRKRSMPPSTLTLLGLVRHMAEVERTWFRKVINGEDLPLVWSPDGDYQVAYDASGSTRAEAFAAWEAEVEHSRRIERGGAVAGRHRVQPALGGGRLAAPRDAAPDPRVRPPQRPRGLPA